MAPETPHMYNANEASLWPDFRPDGNEFSQRIIGDYLFTPSPYVSDSYEPQDLPEQKYQPEELMMNVSDNYHVPEIVPERSSLFDPSISHSETTSNEEYLTQTLQKRYGFGHMNLEDGQELAKKLLRYSDNGERDPKC